MDISVEDERDPEKMRQILARMTPGEEDRFEHYRRSRFNRTGISQIMRRSLADDARVDENSAVVVAALAKMFVGDLVSAARTARAARGGEGEPIGPAGGLTEALSNFGNCCGPVPCLLLKSNVEEKVEAKELADEFLSEDEDEEA
ncbi:hypothetical protein JL721_12037 [Aureococcus anophagefferens]|nr:hypothetical protein JL721_12037 [Aureococcus anophagefferens]